LLAASARPAAALDAALRAEEIGRAHLRLTARTLSEREALRYASVRTKGLDVALSLAGRDPGGMGAAGRRAWDALVRSRALVLDEMAARQRTAAGTSDPEVAELEGRLQRARERLAKLVVRGPGGAAPGEHRRAIDRARQEKEDAERALAEKSAAFRQAEAEARLGLEEVAGALAPGSGFVAYVRFDRTPAPVPPGVPSYMAFVMRAGEKEPAVVPLGAAAEIESSISRWKERTAREAVAEDRPSREIEAAYRQAGDLLRQRVWDPVAVHLGSAARVFVVPDGGLNLVDLAALPTGESGYLAETGPLIHYLSAERDLVSSGVERAGGTGILALGGPDFDAGAPVVRRSGGGGAGAPYWQPFRGALPSCGDFASLRFETLRSAPREAEEVAGIWRRRAGARGVDALEGAAASESAFKRLAPGKQVLHLATHGFFLGGRCASAAASSRAGSLALAGEEDLEIAAGESPLLLSGLALAGANRRAAAGPGEEDGILTAEEIAALDLRGVEWAVLSACDTGVGEVTAGEGVLGLRRAFAVAGARTVIMSLWSVDDRTARRWMQVLYEGRWVKGLTTAEAVRAADLELLRARREKHASTHPYYWAGFIAARS
jgi:CHAT domain-containing protein